MATKTASRGVALAPRRAASVSKIRFNELKARSAAAGRRLREAADEDGDALLSVGTGVALALYEQNGRQLPTLFGVDPAIVWGTVGYVVTRRSKSKTARMFRTASVGLVTVGAHRSAQRGSIRVSGDDGGGYVGSDDEDDDDL